MAGFDLSVSVSLATVFVQGLLSFFSPCVLPLLPLYLGYLSGSMGDNQGAQTSWVKTLVNTLFFVIGISAAFFLLALGLTALGQALHQYQKIIIQVGAFSSSPLACSSWGCSARRPWSRTGAFASPCKSWP